MASAALDRLTHHAHVIEIQGASYRQKQRKAKQSSKSKKTEGEK
jgi:DNA replication protein DnaC